MTEIAYDAKGQRTLIQYANGAATAYAYDHKTFRLTNLKTTRPGGLNGLASQIFNDPATVQDLSYIYDPVGNITRIADAALKTVFNANQQVDSASDYTLRSALPADPGDGPRTHRPIRFRLFAARRQLSRLSLCRRDAAERSPGAAQLHRTLRLRSRRQFPDDGASGRERQLDARLCV